MPNFKKILAIETSCDDTSVAIISEGGWVDVVCSANQDLAHAPFGGVVPEIASRNHTIALIPLIDQCLKKANVDWPQIEAVAVTNRPGLIGSLIVGLVVAKSICQSKKIPLIGVNHLEGHLLAPFLKDHEYQPPQDFTYPFIALAVSGGHSTLYHVHDFNKYQVLGSTLDDAAGEAFDKFAKLLQLGMPGGVKVDQLAKSGDKNKFQFPRSMAKEDNYLMSFSGLKSSATRAVEKLSPQEIEIEKANLCASFQEAIVEILMAKIERAVQQLKLKKVVITGGVSANSRLREVAQSWAQKKGVQVVIPPIRYCTDNAAMIGYAGLMHLNIGESHSLDLGPSPQVYESDFIL